VPEGSPLTPLLQVLVAAFRNRRLPLPDDDAELYEVRRPQSGKRRLLCHTYQLRSRCIHFSFPFSPAALI
jgi:hypothetical protein